MASKKTPKREAKTRVKNNAQNRKKSGGYYPLFTFLTNLPF